MKTTRLRSIVIYGIIILLCAAVAVGYFTSDKGSRTTNAESSTANASAGNNTAEPAPAVNENETGATGETVAGPATEGSAAGDESAGDNAGAADAAGATDGTGAGTALP